MRGITGNDKVMSYYDDNKKSVQKFKKLDIFNLEKILPSGLYKIPYEILNRLNMAFDFHKDKKRYFDIQYKTTRDFIIPFIEQKKKILNWKRQ